MTTLPFNKTDHSEIYSVNLGGSPRLQSATPGAAVIEAVGRKKLHGGALFSVHAHKGLGNFNTLESTLRPLTT